MNLEKGDCWGVASDLVSTLNTIGQKMIATSLQVATGIRTLEVSLDVPLVTDVCLPTITPSQVYVSIVPFSSLFSLITPTPIRPVGSVGYAW